MKALCISDKGQYVPRDENKEKLKNTSSENDWDRPERWCWKEEPCMAIKHMHVAADRGQGAALESHSSVGLLELTQSYCSLELAGTLHFPFRVLIKIHWTVWCPRALEESPQPVLYLFWCSLFPEHLEHTWPMVGLSSTLGEGMQGTHHYLNQHFCQGICEILTRVPLGKLGKIRSDRDLGRTGSVWCWCLP